MDIVDSAAVGVQTLEDPVRWRRCRRRCSPGCTACSTSVLHHLLDARAANRQPGIPGSTKDILGRCTNTRRIPNSQSADGGIHCREWQLFATSHTFRHSNSQLQRNNVSISDQAMGSSVVPARGAYCLRGARERDAGKAWAACWGGRASLSSVSEGLDGDEGSSELGRVSWVPTAGL